MPEQQVLIRPGMDENIDARELPIGTPRLLQNFRVRQGARFEKRPGQSSLGVTGLPASATANWISDMNGVAVAGVADAALNTLTSQNVYVHNGSSSSPRWSYLGRHAACVPLRRFTIAGRERSTAYSSMSVVAANGLLYACYVDVSGTPAIYIVEMTPEGTALRTKLLTGERSPRLVWVDSTMLLVTNASGTVKVRTLSLETFGLGSATSLATAAANSTTVIDAAPQEDVNTWLCCYASSANNLKVLRLNSSHAIVQSNDITTVASPLHYSIAGSLGAGVAVVYSDGTGARVTLYSATLASPNDQAVASGTWAFQFGVVRTDTDKFQLLLGGISTSAAAPELTTPFTQYATVTTAGVVVTQQLSWHFAPASKPVRLGSDGQAQVYCWMSNGYGSWTTAFQSRHVLALFEPISSPVLGGGIALAGISYEHLAYSNENFAGCMADLGDGRLAAALNWVDPGKFAGIDCAIFTLANPSTSVEKSYRQTETAGGALFVSGGCLSDAVEAPHDLTTYLMSENGFAHAPLVSAAIATGGNMTIGQAYNYLACYRRIDGHGRVHRSAGSIIATGIVPTGVHKKATVYVTTLGVSNRWGKPGEPVVAEVYRSWLGGPYYYVTATSTVSPTPSNVSISDTSADADIIDDDGAFDATAAQPEPPSGARLFKRWGARAAAVGWVENRVQLSKLYRSDTSWEFVDDAEFWVEVAEPITALGWMDGAGVIFTASKIYIVTGDGPDDRGVGSFADPRELPCSVGADSPHVVETPAGLMFKGGGTIYLLPRGFGPPQPVGDAIQRTMAAYPYLRGAQRCVNENYDLTHFLFANGDTPTAGTLVAVWNNTLQAWSRDQLACDIGAIGSVDGIFHALLATWTSVSQVPARKLGDSVRDLNSSGASTWIESRVGFGDWRPWGPLGWGRLDRLQIHGEVDGPCDLNLVTVVDGVSGMNAVGHTTLSTKHMTGLGQFYAETQVEFPPGGAYRFDLYDSPPGNANMTSGLVLHSVAFTASEPDGLRRVSDAERF